MGRMRRYDLSRIAVLVVEDCLFMREVVSSVLRALGIQRIRTAENGLSALKALKEFIPDVILLDLVMPEMNGFRFCRRVRAGDAPVQPFVPIIVVSGYSDSASIAAARDAGANEFLAKPISAATELVAESATLRLT